MIFGDSVARLRAPLISGPFGNQTYDWPNAVSVTYAAEVQPVTWRNTSIERNPLVRVFAAATPRRCERHCATTNAVTSPG